MFNAKNPAYSNYSLSEACVLISNHKPTAKPALPLFLKFIKNSVNPTVPEHSIFLPHKTSCSFALRQSTKRPVLTTGSSGKRWYLKTHTDAMHQASRLKHCISPTTKYFTNYCPHFKCSNTNSLVQIYFDIRRPYLHGLV